MGCFVSFSGECIMRRIWVVLGILLVSHLAMAASACYVHFINNGGDSVVAISLASPGSNQWKPVKLLGVVAGGYVSFDGGYMGDATTTVDVSHGCAYDILVEFSKRKALLLSDVDICHTHRFDIDKRWWQAQSIS
jgi:hypothetical protein